MSTVKSALKAAKVALDAQKYSEAVENANKVLAIDSQNYHAYVLAIKSKGPLQRMTSCSNVFLGLSRERLSQYEDSEKAYSVATKIKAKDVLAWQGLINLYEIQSAKKLNAYHDAALQLAELFMEQ